MVQWGRKKSSHSFYSFMFNCSYFTFYCCVHYMKVKWGSTLWQANVCRECIVTVSCSPVSISLFYG